MSDLSEEEAEEEAEAYLGVRRGVGPRGRAGKGREKLSLVGDLIL